MTADELMRCLRLLREWMRETDWMQFCREHPEAKNWFEGDA